MKPPARAKPLPAVPRRFGLPLRCLALWAGLTGSAATAADVNLVGLFPGKAVVAIDGAPMRTLSVGAAIGRVKLLSTERDSATFEIDGMRRTLTLGQYYAGSANTGRNSTTLNADGRGHFVTQGSVNGGSLGFLVDTGASLVVMSAIDATRLGINYREGQRMMSHTANGTVPFFRIMLGSVRIGDIVLNNVEAGVQEGGLPIGIALLGMSFLNRTDMQRSGQTMVLTQRF